jgi:hypothetical protein
MKIKITRRKLPLRELPAWTKPMKIVKEYETITVTKEIIENSRDNSFEICCTDECQNQSLKSKR